MRLSLQQASIVGVTPERSSTTLVVLSFPYSTDPPMFETDGLAYTLSDAVEGKKEQSHFI